MSSNGTIKYIRISCIAKVICWYKAGIVILVHIHSVSTVVSFGLLQVSALAGNLLRICTLLNQQALSKLFIQFCWLNSLFWNSQKVTNYNRYLKKTGQYRKWNVTTATKIWTLCQVNQYLMMMISHLKNSSKMWYILDFKLLCLPA